MTALGSDACIFYLTVISVAKRSREDTLPNLTSSCLLTPCYSPPAISTVHKYICICVITWFSAFLTNQSCTRSPGHRDWQPVFHKHLLNDFGPVVDHFWTFPHMGHRNINSTVGEGKNIYFSPCRLLLQRWYQDLRIGEKGNITRNLLDVCYAEFVFSKNPRMNYSRNMGGKG